MAVIEGNSPGHVKSIGEMKETITSMTAAGYTNMALALGSRLGIFDLMSKCDSPKTYQEIAEIGNFKERYIYEWLGVMVCNNIVEVTADGKWFWLPKHRQPSLCGMSPANIVISTEMAPGLSSPFLQILKCFEKNGPLDEGMNIVEFGCSTGITSQELAVHVPRTTILGLDISEQAVKTASQTALQSNITNVEYLVGDMCNLPSNWTDKWEFAFTIDTLHDVPFTSRAILELWRVLKPGGQALVTDINLHTSVRDNRDNPSAAMMYSISLLHCMVVSLAEAGEGLGNAWGYERAINMFENAGFSVRILETSQFTINYLLTKKTV